MIFGFKKVLTFAPAFRNEGSLKKRFGTEEKAEIYNCEVIYFTEG